MPELILGARFGRFVVLDRLGSGGMGVVISAYDPDLDRKVAIKVLRPDGLGTDGAEARARMLQEAKAMARLAHPNVVTVHEVGTSGDDLFLVMELVEGVTLGDWLETPRRWREVVGVLIAAGRGLAAAHAAGLIHRDFKPHNVLLGSDGRVRVTDFGVVGVAARDGAAAERDVVLGTPAYMAPEQHLHLPTDARADQFSFCVTLFEALYRVRPFDGATPAELRAATCDGVIREVPGGHDVPSRLHELVVRGLAREPGARFPSMNTLLDELERDPWRARRRAGAAAGVMALAGFAVFGWTRGAPEPRPAAASCPDATLDGVWDTDTRTRIRAAFVAARPDRGAATFDRVATRLDDLAARWSDAYDRACADRLDARMACLGGLRGELGELTGLFAGDTDAIVVDGALAAISDLPSLDTCQRPRAGPPPAPPADPGLRARVVELERRLGRAEALRRAGLLREATAIAEEVVADAETLPYPPLLAEAYLSLGRIRIKTGDGEGAEQALSRAARAGAAAGDDLLVATAWTDELWAVGYLRGRAKDALDLQPFVEAAIIRAGDPARLRADHLMHIGGMMIELGRWDEAVDYLERARRVWSEELDPAHPEASRPVLSLGNIANYQGRTADSRRLYEEVLAIREAALGPDHIDLAGPLINLGGIHAESGDLAGAVELCGRGLAIEDRVLGIDSPRRSNALRCLAEAHQSLGDPEKALGFAEEAVRLCEGPGGEAGLFYALTVLGALVAETDPPRAITLCERALADFDTEEMRDHPDNAYALTCLGRAQLARGAGERAVAALERAIALRASGAAARDLGEMRFALARALWLRPGGRARARELAAAARDDYRAAGFAAVADFVETWLAGRR